MEKEEYRDFNRHPQHSLFVQDYGGQKSYGLAGWQAWIVRTLQFKLYDVLDKFYNDVFYPDKIEELDKPKREKLRKYLSLYKQRA